MALAEPLVSTTDLATFMRTTFSGSGEEAQADLILRVVSAWARTAASRNYNTSDLLPPDDVVGVVLSAARREMVNPDRIISESMGPLSITRAQPPDGFFTAGELAILRRKSKSGGLYTVSTYRDEASLSTGYLHMRRDLSDEPFPYLEYGDPGWGNTIH